MMLQYNLLSNVPTLLEQKFAEPNLVSFSPILTCGLFKFFY